MGRRSSLCLSLSACKFACTPSLLHSTYQSTSTCHRCTNTFALAQGCHEPELHLTWWRSVVKRHHGWNTREPAKDCRSSISSSSSSKIVSRHGHHSRYGHIPTAIETRNDRCDTTVARRNERDRHVEQHQHSTAARVSKTSCCQATPNQRPHSKKLGRQQRQGEISTLRVGPPPVDVSVVRRRRNDACQR